MVLENINLEIEAGEFIILQGESGCGKSTLLSIIAGLLPPGSGEVLADGQPIRSPHPSRILHFQQPSLLPWLNVRENIAFGCKLRRDQKNIDERIRYHIELMGLTGKEKVYPSELSVGMAHRVCIARAMMAEPDIMLLDEPFRSLDTINSIRLMEELISLWQKVRFTAVFVTHNIEESVFLGARVVLLGGTPTRIRDIIHINLPYPRDMADLRFIHTRNLIFQKCRETGGSSE